MSTPIDMSKPIYYFQITEEMNSIVRNLYFISKTPFDASEINVFNESFLDEYGIIDSYIKIFPHRKLSASVGSFYEFPIANDNIVVYNIKHSTILKNSFVRLAELSYNGLFTDCDLYKEKGIFVFYENYEIKEKMYHLNDILEGSCSPCCSYTDEDLDDIDKWTNQPDAF
jgi:hypothetical protein